MSEVKPTLTLVVDVDIFNTFGYLEAREFQVNVLVKEDGTIDELIGFINLN